MPGYAKEYGALSLDVIKELYRISAPTDTVDIATGWTEQGASWGRGEFLNYHLLHHFADRIKPVQFTRSRHYHKDDNVHVEQKNWTHVR